MTAVEEKKLIENAKKDPKAFGVLFDLHYSKILNYCLRRIGDVAVAEDITSTVFVKAYEKLWQFHWRGVPFLAWLYRIAGNEVKTYYRKGKGNLVSLEDLKEMSGFEPSQSAKVEKEMIEKEEMMRDKMIFKKVRNLLSRLDEKYQEVLLLRYFEEKKVREISQIVNKKEGTVKSLLSRGVRKLRDLMLIDDIEETKAKGVQDQRDDFAEKEDYKYFFSQIQR